MPFPEAGLVYDYKLDDGGASEMHRGDEEEEEDKKTKKRVCSMHVCAVKLSLTDDMHVKTA